MFKYTLVFNLIFFLPTPVDAVTAPFVGNKLNGLPCEGNPQGHGPFDYIHRQTFKHDLFLVESAHFTPDVENLVKGNTGESPTGDLMYTLRAWPNHHRALFSVIRLQLDINKKITKYKLEIPPECYFQRAIHYSPKDPVIYSLFGFFLRKIGRLDEALKYYEKSIELDPENAKTAYSFSLLLIDLKRFEDAVKYAKVAYKNGQPPKGLKQKLEKLGVWSE